MFVRYPTRNFQHPLALMDDVRRTMDLVFALDRPRVARPFQEVEPRFEVESKEDGLSLKADLPGVSPEQLEVALVGTELTIESKAEAQRPEGYQLRRQERPSPRWKRTLTLPFEAQAEAVTAKLEHGVFELWVPKSERAKPRLIPVQG